MKDPQIRRFWKLVEKTNTCWNWLGNLRQPKGTPRFGQKSATRITWELINGPIPTNTNLIRTCNNKICINPNHITLRYIQPDFTIVFWNNVNKTAEGCWNWIGYVTCYGYGLFNGKGAHRVAYEISIGRIPKGMFICHTCDNRKCVNPSHLYAGTRADNINDAMVRDRIPRSENHYAAKFSNEDVRMVRQSNAPTKDLARIYGMSERTVRAIRAGTTRKKG